MKLGFMIYSLSRALADETITVSGAFALMKELGAEGVDITGGHVAPHSNAEVRRMVEDAGLVVSCQIGGANLTMTDPAQRAESIDQIKRVVDGAVELGTSQMLVTTGGCAPDQDTAEGRRNVAAGLRVRDHLSEARRNVAAGLAEVIPHAKAARDTLSIEDFGSPVAPYQTSDQCLETCELAGPELMITYDSGNMVMGDEDPVEFLEAVQHRMVHAHAKDWELLAPDAEASLIAPSGKRYVGTVVGSGVLDYPAIISKLKAMNYEGFLAFEYEGVGDPIAAAREGMAYLRDLI